MIVILLLSAHPITHPIGGCLLALTFWHEAGALFLNCPRFPRPDSFFCFIFGRFPCVCNRLMFSSVCDSLWWDQIEKRLVSIYMLLVGLQTCSSVVNSVFLDRFAEPDDAMSRQRNANDERLLRRRLHDVAESSLRGKVYVGTMMVNSCLVLPSGASHTAKAAISSQLDKLVNITRLLFIH